MMGFPDADTFTISQVSISPILMCPRTIRNGAEGEPREFQVFFNVLSIQCTLPISTPSRVLWQSFWQGGRRA